MRPKKLFRNSKIQTKLQSVKSPDFCGKPAPSKVDFPMGGVYLVKNTQKVQGGHGPDDNVIVNGTFTKQIRPISPSSQTESTEILAGVSIGKRKYSTFSAENEIGSDNNVIGNRRKKPVLWTAVHTADKINHS